ncbi:MAG: hypothetical protein ABFD25_03235 [Clostridiaceae bacterium]
MPTKEQIEQIIRELQKILHLQDWQITLYLVCQYEMKDIMKVDHYNHIGCCKRFPNQKEAQISLNIDHSRIEECWYSTVMHEMLHIHTCVLDDIVQNITDNCGFERKHFFYESETLNCSIEKIINGIYPVSNFDHILKPDTAK